MRVLYVVCNEDTNTIEALLAYWCITFEVMIEVRSPTCPGARHTLRDFRCGHPLGHT